MEIKEKSKLKSGDDVKGEFTSNNKELDFEKRVKEAVEQMNLIRAGKLKGIPARDLFK